MPLTALQLVAKVTADTSEAEAGLKNVKKAADDASGSEGGGGIKGFIQHVGEMVTALGIVDGVRAGFDFLKDQVQDSIKVAQQYQLVQAQTSAVLKSTGDASGQTAQGIQDLAEHLSTLTPFSRDATQSAENMLLTFTNIHQNLPLVTQTTLDFATAMHMDATSAALQLGKALNDPATGYSKLQREGVTFTKAQIETMKAMEKGGNMAGAQAVMLQELQKEFGGSATAAGSTFAGSLQILQNQLEDTKENIGAALIPVLSQLLRALAPLMQGFAQFVSQALGKLSGFLTTTLIPTMQQWLPVLGTIVSAAQTLGGVFMSALQPALDAIGKQFDKTSGPGLTVAGVTQGITKVVQQLTPFVQQAGVEFGKLAGWFVTSVLPAIIQFAGFVATNVIPVVVQLIGWVARELAPIVQKLATIFVTDVLPALEQVWRSVAGSLLPALEKLWNQLEPQLMPVLNLLGSILKNVVGPGLSDIIGIVGWLIDKLADLEGALKPVTNLLGGLTNAASGALGGIGNLLGKLPHLAGGGTMDATGAALVGENGPEIVTLPGGARVTPLSQVGGPAPLLPAGLAAAVGGFGGAGGMPAMVQVQSTIVIDGQKIAQVVTRHQPTAIRNATGARSF